MTEAAQWTMPALHALSAIRAPWLVFLMQYMTWFGDGMVFAAVGITAYWCWNKQAGEYMLSVGLAGTAIGHALKNLFRVPRPWLLDRDFAIVESARARATGYSFPSGHTQMGIGVYGALALKTGNRAVRLIAAALCVIIPFSRMLLGVHTPLDIAAAALISVVLLALLRHSFDEGAEKRNRTYAVLLLVSAVSLAVALAFRAGPGATEEELVNEWDGIKAICQAVAGIAALWLGYTADARWTHWETAAPLLAQILKTALGLAGMGGLRMLVHFLPDSVPLRILGYFVALSFGTAVWPMTFRYFARIGKRGDGAR